MSTDTSSTADQTDQQTAGQTDGQTEGDQNQTQGQQDRTEAGTEGQPEGANREAAARRRQLREAQAERDRLRTTNVELADRVEALQRREVERLAAETLAEPGDLWAFGTTVAELLDEDGEVDEQTALAAIAALAASRPGTRRAAQRWNSPAASGYGYTRPQLSGEPSWHNVLSGRAAR